LFHLGFEVREVQLPVGLIARARIDAADLVITTDAVEVRLFAGDTVRIRREIQTNAGRITLAAGGVWGVRDRWAIVIRIAVGILGIGAVWR
jgi:hypothetical protein